MAQRTQDGSGANLRALITNLSPAKRKLLGQRLKQKSRDAVPNQGILRPRTASPILLSFAQQRLWFLDQYEPASSVYNLASALRLKGSLNIRALAQSLTEIIRRHESLRTTFTMLDSEPVQVIAPPLDVALNVADLSATAQGEREEVSRRLASEEAQRPFDLARGPLFRMGLIRLGEDDHVLLITMHHIVSDGWSVGVLYRELSALYEAFSQGKPSPLPDLPIQYADFAVWQREWLQGEVLDRQLSYWKKQLDGIPAVLNLPTDRPRPAVQSYRGARQSIELSKELTDGLKALSRKEDVTPFMTLLAAFQTLLYRYTGQDDIVVGSPIANRNRIEIEGLIGFFVNTLVLRSTFSDNPTFRELLARVRQTTLEAYEHQDLPFEKLVEELKPERCLSHSPLFQVMFVFQNAPTTPLHFEGLKTSLVPLSAETAKFDLTLSIRETVNGLGGSLQYSTELFAAATVDRMIGHLKTLLNTIIANPDQRISQLPILRPVEMHQLLVEWNDTKRAYRTDKCIHELFEEQAEKTPDAVAVTFEDQQLTYRELNHRGNQLAHYLKRLGVTAETVVGICLERSLEMVIGVLGILKAGSAYLPLDPNCPKDRLGFLLEDSRASIILTEQRFVEQFRRRQDTLVLLDDEWEKIARGEIANLMSNVTPDNLAYILYTSGSTGAPKGVMIEHESVVNYLSWFNQAEMAGGLQSFPFITNLAFDASLKQLFGPLLRANSVRVLSDEAISQPTDLLKALSACSGLNCVPTLWSALLESNSLKDSFPSIDRLSVLILGGEQLTNSLIDRTFTVMPHAEIWNFYGPTETTANAIVGRVTPDQTITLGRPIANTQIYLLDSNLQPVPAGVPGEIYVGGAGLARGYFNRPELTAEKFIANPFSDKPGARLYRTGDLARYLSDGNIEFLGRIDNQVKVRGFRIELGEIESVLCRYPAVREAVVLAREDVGNPKTEIQNRKSDRRLVAYVVPDKRQTCTTRELRRFLKWQLPEYMIPSAFVFLDALPVNPNGKVDRKALPAPDQHRSELEESFVAPRTPVEEMIAEIWAEVLKVDTIGVHDNFFDLGGHSLLATQAMSRTCQAFKVEIPLRDLFERPTVADFAERVERASSGDRRLPEPSILAVRRDKELPLSFSQQRLWFLDQYEPNSAVYNIPSVLRLKGTLNVGALEHSLEEIVRRHESLRTTFSVVEGDPVQVIAPSLRISLDVIDLRDHPEIDRGEEARRFANEETRRPFDLARGPLFRASLIRLGEDDHVLLLTMHHIVSDGWSIGVLYRELSALYEAFSQGKSSPLADLPIQYADFASWQREWLQGEVLENQLSYWKKQLRDAPTVLNLPADRPRPPVQGHAGNSQTFELPKSLSASLKALSRETGATLYMTLLAAFSALLYRYTGQSDLLVGSPTAGRTRSETERLIGFFVNTLVLRIDLSGNITFRDLLTRVHKTALDAFAHQDLPFEKLVEALQPKRNASHRSLIQVAFAFQNIPPQALKLSGVAARPVHIGIESAKLDLTLFMRETEDGLVGTLNYNTDLYDSPRMSRLLEDFKRLLEILTTDPEKHIDELPSFGETAPSEKSFDAEIEPDFYASSNLTKNQLLIWAGQKLEPGRPVYNTPYTFTIYGEVDAIHFQKAFETLVNSSDALRTVIREIDETPQQFVRPELYDQLEYLDFSKDSDSQSALERWLETRARISFDFNERLFDSALIKLEEKRFVWYLNVHHIVIDGVSRATMFRWVAELYRRSVATTLRDKVELPSFSDYIRFEREYRASQRYRDAENYWKRKLANKSEPISFYGKRPAARTGPMNRVSWDLGVKRTEKLRLLAVRNEVVGPTENVSVFNVLAALLVTYLYRISGIREHSIGTPVHNRKSQAFRDTIGLFMEVLPLRVTVQDDDTFLSLIKKVKAAASELSRFSYPIGNSSHNKVYDVLLNFHTTAFALFDNKRVDVKEFPAAHESHSLALQIHDFDQTGSFVIDFDFHSEVFDSDQCSRAVHHFLQILDAFLEKPDQRVVEPRILTVGEEKRILIEFNQSQALFSKPHVLPLLFEAQAETTPNCPAVIDGDQSLSYTQLNESANRLAHYLQSLGVGPESIVAICVEPSSAAIAGILGILKAGGACLPVDPQYPKERLAFMLEDAQASVLLTQRKLLEQQPDLSQVIDSIGSSDNDAPGRATLKRHPSLVCLDADEAYIRTQSSANPLVSITRQNLAYVIYTSGSTGTPKAVMLPHEGVCNRLLWEQNVYPFSASDRMLQKSTLAFDTSILEIFRPLLLGAAMVMAAPEARQDCRYLANLIGKCGVSVAEFVPSMLRFLLDEKSIENCSSLKYVFSGGEVLPFEIQDKFFAKISSALYNTYGPTETSIDVTHWRCVGNDKSGNVPIGQPIGNTEIYILDRHGKPVPVGIAGELHIGGAALARGYVNRPELTAEKFVPNPFNDKLGARLYKTGDLARYLPDGNIEFLGRVDDQVKIRGFRVELGEIEAVLAQHPEVKETVVLAREDGGNPESAVENRESDRRLVAYVVPANKQSNKNGDLRNFLKQKLPEYMIPSLFVFLDALPLTSNGKIDRKALPEPERRCELESNYAAPRTPVEEMIAETWAEVLKVDTVGVYDNFFDLGGHSLLAMRAMSRLCHVFKTEVPLRALFEGPTVAELATRIEEALGEDHRLPVPSLIPVSRDQALPLSFAQERLWFLDQYEPNSSVYNLPGALRLRGSLDVGALERSLNEIFRRHESLRTTFSIVDGEPVQVIAPPVGQPLAVVDLRDHPEDEREGEARRFAGEEARRVFDLAEGPLFRSKLLWLDEDDHMLLLTMHHIVSDGWSMGLFYSELATLYRGFVNGEPSPLPELPIQYADFAVWQREWLRGQVLDSQLSYWKKQLDGMPAPLNLPIKHPRPAVQSRRGGRQSFVLSRELSRQLKDLSRKEGVTLFMTLLAAFQTLLHRYTGQEDVVVGSPIANRNRPKIENLIGFFVNILFLRTDLSGNPSYRALLKRVREVCLGAYAHQEFPFQKVVEALHRNRDTVQRSLGQVGFAFQNYSRQKVELPGLSVAAVRTDLGSAKSALTLFVWDGEEGLGGSLNYASDLFEAATITQMVEHFQMLLNAVVADPDRRLLDLPPFLERSRAELLEAVQWANEQSWQFETDTTEGREQGEL